jgi:hypothetical protein
MLAQCKSKPGDLTMLTPLDTVNLYPQLTSSANADLAMAEWFKLRDGQIAEHTLLYDARGFAMAFGMAA